MSARARIEVEDARRGGVIRYIDLATTPPEAEALAILDRAVETLADVTNLGRDAATFLLLSELTFLAADADAYERETERRGVLF